ncbi:MAG: hypothetical protein J0H64_10810, partial [Actinobacteria bacterium]|nr:hypothetical protein [Actinomycetota bacterium]
MDTVSAAPIAVDDVARVRVGEVVDIAVLENDIAPPGQHLVLSPDVKMAGKGSAAGTAFASGNVLRFLAPGKKGSYELDYQTYGVSEPQKFAVGRVRIEVLPAITNAAPRPAPLTVRLARGGSGTVQVPLSGIDPDGDRVRLIGASDGSAKGLVAAALPGSATIRVTAADDAQLGANELTYTVADAKTQCVGVLRVIVTKADESSQRPVTYSDYVRVPQNAAKPVVIRPLDNDIDPSGGALSIAGDVEPNLAKSSPSYAVQQGRLAGSKLQQGRVEVSGNDQLGASSFTYRAISDTSKSEASGLIVVEVSEEIGRQAPAVQDTLLSAQDWKKLAGGGVDVVTGRVSWASGDIDALKLDIVGSDKAKFRTDGKRSISSIGEADKQGGRVMFKLSGKDLAGTDVQTYGFLTIPSYDDLRLTLKPGVQALKAKEGGPPATSKLTELIELAAGDQAVFDTAAPFAVQRSAARCQASDGGARLSYTAGEGAPWSDNCLVRVRLKDQSPGAWTVLAVPVDVEPKDPTPLLKPRERTVTQGAAETIDLTEMVEWAGNRQGDLKDLVFSTVNPGPPFTVVSSNGPIVEVRAAATAAPNEQARMRVTVTGKAGKSS